MGGGSKENRKRKFKHVHNHEAHPRDEDSGPRGAGEGRNADASTSRTNSNSSNSNENRVANGDDRRRDRLEAKGGGANNVAKNVATVSPAPTAPSSAAAAAAAALPGGRTLSKKQQKRDMKRMLQQQQQQQTQTHQPPGRQVGTVPSRNGSGDSSNRINHQGDKPQSAAAMLPKSSTGANTTKSVYKRANIYPKPFPPPGSSAAEVADVPKGRFVTPADACFNALLRCSYEGFAVDADEPASSYSASSTVSVNGTVNPPPMSEATHALFLRTLDGLGADGFYKFDVNQPMGLGTKLSRTFVSRCVVGDAGITYKYLGTRIFSYPWTDGEEGASGHCVALRKLNAEVVDRTKAHLASLRRPEVGSCQYNLVLINRCFPEGALELKPEPMFGGGAHCAVSWHADSSLDHFSSIAVYHTEMEGTGPEVRPASGHAQNGAGSAPPRMSDDGSSRPSKKHKADATNSANRSAVKSEVSVPWQVAMRVRFDSEGPTLGRLKPSSTANTSDGQESNGGAADCPHPEMTSIPPVCVPLPRRCTYYMLDDFNHHHQHAVMPGTTHRYASTHRVSRVDGHSFKSIDDRAKAALQSGGLSVRQLRLEQGALNEVEFEWLRQYYIQGARHARLNVWWREPMRVLGGHWEALEARTARAIEVLRIAALGLSDTEAEAMSRKQRNRAVSRAAEVTEEAFDVMIEHLVLRQSKRAGWAERAADRIYKQGDKDERPIRPPFAFGRSVPPRTTPSSEHQDESNGETQQQKSNDSNSMHKEAPSVFVSPMPENLTPTLEQLRSWKAAFLERPEPLETSN